MADPLSFRFTVAVAGMRGAGKTTLLARLRESLARVERSAAAGDWHNFVKLHKNPSEDEGTSDSDHEVLTSYRLEDEASGRSCEARVLFHALAANGGPSLSAMAQTCVEGVRAAVVLFDLASTSS